MFKHFVKKYVKNYTPRIKSIPTGLLIFGLMFHSSVLYIGSSNSYFNDTAPSTLNAYTSSTLSFDLASSGDFSDDITPTQDATSMITMTDTGAEDFRYKLRALNVTGDLDLCAAINIKASLDSTEQYNGTLAGLASGVGPFTFADPEAWDFEASLTSSDTALENKSCNFDLTYNAWQIGFAEGAGGFTDKGVIASTINSGTWGVITPFSLLSPFAVFGASDVSDTHDTVTGNGTDVSGGMIGSNRSVTIGGTNVQLGIRAGGDVSTGNGTNVGTQGIVANGAVVLGGTNTIIGDVHGASLNAGNGTDLYGNVVSGSNFTIGGTATAHTNVDAQTASLGNSADVLGTLTLPLGVSPTLGGGATVGTLENDGTPSPDAPDTFTEVVLPTPNAFTANTNHQNILSSGTLTLAPGIYGNLTSGNAATLNLSAGEYVFNTINLGGTNTINVNVTGGEILIFVVGNVTTGNSTEIVILGGGTAEDVYLESGGVVQLGGTNEWHGTIYSTKSNNPAEESIVTGNGTKVWGGLYSAEQVKLGGTNEIDLVGPFFGTYTGAGPSIASGVVLNELYPRPYAVVDDPESPFDREWIELYNGGGSAIDVLGWSIKVASTTHVIEATCSGGANKMQPYSGDTSIGSGELLVLEFCTNASNSKMSNTGAAVELRNTASTLLDSHTYPTTAIGKSHQRIPDGGIWVDPEPTPGEPNQVSMQDLIDAGLSEEMIQQIIALLAEKGQTLLEVAEEPLPPNTETKEEVLDESTEAPTKEVIPEVGEDMPEELPAEGGEEQNEVPEPVEESREEIIENETPEDEPQEATEPESVDEKAASQNTTGEEEEVGQESNESSAGEAQENSTSSDGDSESGSDQGSSSSDSSSDSGSGSDSGGGETSSSGE